MKTKQSDVGRSKTKYTTNNNKKKLRRSKEQKVYTNFSHTNTAYITRSIEQLQDLSRENEEEEEEKNRMRARCVCVCVREQQTRAR